MSAVLRPRGSWQWPQNGRDGHRTARSSPTDFSSPDGLFVPIAVILATASAASRAKVGSTLAAGEEARRRSKTFANHEKSTGHGPTINGAQLSDLDACRRLCKPDRRNLRPDIRDYHDARNPVFLDVRQGLQCNASRVRRHRSNDRGPGWLG